MTGVQTCALPICFAGQRVIDAEAKLQDGGRVDRPRRSGNRLLVQNVYVSVVVAGADRVGNAVGIEDVCFGLAVTGKERQPLTQEVVRPEVALIVVESICRRGFKVVGGPWKVWSWQGGQNGRGQRGKS